MVYSFKLLLRAHASAFHLILNSVMMRIGDRVVPDL